MYTFPSSISIMWNANGFIQDLNLVHWIHFLSQKPLHYEHARTTWIPLTLSHRVQPCSCNLCSDMNSRLYCALSFTRTTSVLWKGETCSMSNCWSSIKFCPSLYQDSGLDSLPHNSNESHLRAKDPILVLL